MWRDGDPDVAVWSVSTYDPWPDDPDAVFYPGTLQLYRNDQDHAHRWVVLRGALDADEQRDQDRLVESAPP